MKKSLFNYYLFVYCIAILVCLIYVVFFDDVNIINKIVTAVTLPGTILSIAELFNTFEAINKEEYELINSFLRLSSKHKKIYAKMINLKYKSKVSSIFLKAEQILDDDELKYLYKIIDNKLDDEKIQEFYLNIKQKLIDNDASLLAEFVKNIKYDNENTINNIVDDTDTYDTSEQDILDVVKSRLSRNNIIYRGLVIFAFMLLIFISFVNVGIEWSSLNNISTVLAFLMVTMSYLIKNIYKKKSMKEYSELLLELEHDMDDVFINE